MEAWREGSGIARAGSQSHPLLQTLVGTNVGCERYLPPERLHPDTSCPFARQGCVEILGWIDLAPVCALDSVPQHPPVDMFTGGCSGEVRLSQRRLGVRVDPRGAGQAGVPVRRRPSGLRTHARHRQWFVPLAATGKSGVPSSRLSCVVDGSPLHPPLMHIPWPPEDPPSIPDTHYSARFRDFVSSWSVIQWRCLVG